MAKKQQQKKQQKAARRKARQRKAQQQIQHSVVKGVDMTHSINVKLHDDQLYKVSAALRDDEEGATALQRFFDTPRFGFGMHFAQQTTDAERGDAAALLMRAIMEDAKQSSTREEFEALQHDHAVRGYPGIYLKAIQQTEDRQVRLALAGAMVQMPVAGENWTATIQPEDTYRVDYTLGRFTKDAQALVDGKLTTD